MTPGVNVEERVVVGPNVDIVGLIQFLYTKVTGGDWDALLDTLSHIWDVYSIIAIVISLIFFIGFVYAKIRFAQLQEIEGQDLLEAERAWAHVHETEDAKNTRWEEIQRHVGSDNPNDWRLAIIEADILLEEALTNAGYVGATIGDKLKTANDATFATLQDAWEAHKVRNEIAHAGSDFVLTQKAANETIVRYERVFQEFDVI